MQACHVERPFGAQSLRIETGKLVRDKIDQIAPILIRSQCAGGKDVQRRERIGATHDFKQARRDVAFVHNGPAVGAQNAHGHDVQGGWRAEGQGCGRRGIVRAAAPLDRLAGVAL